MLRTCKILLPDGFTPVDGGRSAVGRRERHVHLGRRSAELGSSRPPVSSSSRSSRPGSAAPQCSRTRSMQARPLRLSWLRSPLPTARVPAWRHSVQDPCSNGDPRHRLVQRQRRRDGEPGHDLPGQERQAHGLQGDRSEELAGAGRLSATRLSGSFEGRASALPSSFRGLRRCCSSVPCRAAPSPGPTRRSSR